MSAAPRLTIRRAGDPTTRPRRAWVVRGIIPAAGIAVLYGAGGCGKSTAASDLAFAIANARPWLGVETTPGAVLYIAAERAGQVAACLDCLANREGGAVFEASGPVDLTAPGDGSTAIIAACREIAANAGQSVALVIIDTIAWCFRGDENRAADVMNLMRAVADFRDAIGCAVLLLHHASRPPADPRVKSGARIRGSGALGAAADVVLAMEAVADLRTVRVEKSNAGPIGRRLSFRMDIVTAPDGVETALVAATAGDAPEGAPALSERAARVLASLPEGRTARGSALEAARAAGIVSRENAASGAEQFRRVLVELRDAGCIAFDRDAIERAANNSTHPNNPTPPPKGGALLGNAVGPNDAALGNVGHWGDDTPGGAPLSARPPAPGTVEAEAAR